MRLQKDSAYSLVSAVNNDGVDEITEEFIDEEDAHELAVEEQDDVPSSLLDSEDARSRWIRILHHTWIPEERFVACGDQQIVDGVESIRLFKFVILTVAFIVFVHETVKFFDLEHDTEYGYFEMSLYDGPAIIMDIVSFYVLGRVYKKKIAVDHLAWALVLMAGSLFNSVLNEFRFLQHSFTLFEVFCTWPWQLFAFVAVIVPLFCAVVFKHVQYALQVGQLGMKVLEIALCALIFLLPQVSHPNFHLHHWYVGWLIGMHCNFDTWWSRATMAWYWGLYVNGIAVYGRDPLQTCDYAFYISRDTHCSFLSCFVHKVVGPHNETHTVYNEPHELDWRNCSSRFG